MKIDTTKTYKIPLIPIGKEMTTANQTLVECSIEKDKHYISVNEDGYYPVCFTDTYFTDLVKKKKIVKEN